MKQRSFSMIMLFALSLALGSTLVVSQRGSAQCYGKGGVEVPCAKDPNKQKKPTDVPPTEVPPSPTATKQAGNQVTVVVTPNASQLALLCANLAPVAGAGSNGPNPNSPGSNGSNPNGTSGNGSGQPNTAGFSGFELGGGGLLLGILIGLLMPSILRTLNGDGRGSLAPPPPGIVSPTDDKFIKGEALGGIIGPERTGYTGDGNRNWSGPITTPGDEKFTGGVFAKQGEAGLNYSKQGAAGMDDWERGGFEKQGEAGFQDLHQKGTGGTFDKDDKAGYLKQDGAGMGDGSVHNMDNQFQKGVDAGPGGGPG